MQNLHRHSSYSNLFTSADSAASNEDYAKRAAELGHKVLSSVEHGWQGNVWNTFELAKKYGLKCVIGTEAYWVKDRHEQDRSNHHILICCKSNQGREAMNDALSEANLTGYYFKPRLDLDLLLKLPPKDVMVTSACIAFTGYEDLDDIIVQLHEHFGDNFFLEMQPHDNERQVSWAKHQIELHDKYGIPLIAGLDSHYIQPEDAKIRDYLLEAKGITYPDEEGWYMDYPDDEELVARFKKQGVLSTRQIFEAMDNTDIACEFCDYDQVRVFMKDIKLPSLYPNLTTEEKNSKYRKLISKKFVEFMKRVPSERYQEYFDGVKAEIQTYQDTGMVDYPLLDYAIVKDAIAHGCVITDTGRGSGAGFLTNTLCGFSKVDRFASAIKLYPERFISKTRILETKSLPDLDLNTGTPDLLAEAQERVLGLDHAVAMVAYGTLKKKSAFKIYAKAQGMEFELANTISGQIGDYEKALKDADDEDKDTIDLYDYVDPKYQQYVEASEVYWGVISDKKKAPSAYLLYDGNIRKEIGLMKCKSDSTKKEYITCVMDGAVAENYKFLKNDILKVDSVLLIDKVFKRIGIEHFDVTTLTEKVKNDEAVWNAYANGWTMGINQVEQIGSRNKCMNYKPHNISELSAFVAAVRPGFKSMYQRFENREDFSWGIPALDNLLRTKEMPVSWLLYQEQVMTVLNWAGFPMDQCYGAIKNIAKKHPEKVLPLKEKFIEGFRNRLIAEEDVPQKEAEINAQKVWQVISDNCGYGFNCVSGSTIIVRGAKNRHKPLTIEEMYRIMNDREYAESTNHKDLRKKYQRLGYGTALSMYDDLRIRNNRVVGIYEAGIRQTYKVTTESGSYLICTDNHRFPTPNGKLRLDELKVGDELYCMGEYKKKYFDTSFTDGFTPNVPKPGQMGFQPNPNGASVVYNRAIKEYRERRTACELCGKPYSEDERFELHHRDFNRHNNVSDNYQWLCCSCHKKIHYGHGRTKRYENGIETYLSKIVSIEPYAIEMTYDIEMADPAHTFVSESGLVTSNSSHAYCMALDSLYQMWQKVHYPCEFYEVLLQHFSDKGNKDKVTALKQEMKLAFGINEGAYNFRNDHRKFTADPEKNVIYPALSSIKGIGVGVARDLFKIHDKKYDSFIDLLVDLQKLSINSSVLDTLIKLNAFSEFGNPNQLLKQVEIFNILYERKTFKVAAFADNFPIPLYLVQEYASKITDKTLSGFDWFELCKAACKKTSDIKTSGAQKLQYELQILGYVQTVMPNVPCDYYMLTGWQGKTNQFMQLYQLQTGQSRIIRYRKKYWEENPIEPGAIIKVLEEKNEGKWIKTPDNKWERDWNNLEPNLLRYKVLT